MKDNMYVLPKPYYNLEGFLNKRENKNATSKDWFMKHISGALSGAIRKRIAEAPEIRLSPKERAVLKRKQDTISVAMIKIKAVDKTALEIKIAGQPALVRTQEELGFTGDESTQIAWDVLLKIITTFPHKFDVNKPSVIFDREINHYFPLSFISRRLIRNCLNPELFLGLHENFCMFKLPYRLQKIYSPIFQIGCTSA